MMRVSVSVSMNLMETQIYRGKLVVSRLEVLEVRNLREEECGMVDRVPNPGLGFRV